MHGLATALALLAAAGGVGALRLAWRRRGGGGLILLGWGLLSAAGPAWLWTGAAVDKAVAFALLAPSFIALAAVGAGAEMPTSAKPLRDRKAGVEPPLEGASLWRGCVRALLAGPAGAAMAAALCAAVILHAPASAGVRLATAGFLMPAAWAGALVWATTDERLSRVAAGLGALTALSAVAAWL